MKKLLSLVILAFICISMNAQSLYFSGSLSDYGSEYKIEMFLNQGQRHYIGQVDYEVPVNGWYRYLSQPANKRLPLQGKFVYSSVPDYNSWHYVVEVYLCTTDGTESFNLLYPDNYMMHGTWTIYNSYGLAQRTMNVGLYRK